MTDIDNIFRQSETSTSLSPRSTVWSSLESRLEARHRRQRRGNALLIAASFIFILVISLTYFTAGTAYYLEELESNEKVLLTKEEVAELHDYYSRLQASDLNG